MDEQDIDQSLVERVQQGDKTAFDLLVRKYQHRIALLIARYMRDSNDLQDATQETFIKAYRAINSFRGESAFYTWLYRIAINTAMNFLAAVGRRPPANDIDAEDAERYAAGDGLREHDSPESLISRDELEKDINAVIEALPTELRTAIILRELEGFSYAEIAHTMECPIGTVRSRIFRAREVLDQRLQVLQKIECGA